MGRLAEPHVVEVLAIESRDADREIDGGRDLLELPQAETREGRGVVVDTAEELGRRDVVIHEHAARRDLHQLVEHLVAHREMQDQRVLGAHGAEQPAVRQRLVLHRGLRLHREGVGLEAPRAQAIPQREDVIAHRVAGRQHRMELMDRGHFGARPTTA